MPTLGGRHSIEKSLPLFIGGLLLLIILTFSWTTYREIRGVSMIAAEERLERIVRQLGAAVERANQLRIAQVEATARSPVIRDALSRRPAPTSSAEPTARDRGGFEASLVFDATGETEVARELRELAESAPQVHTAMLLDALGNILAEYGSLSGVPPGPPRLEEDQLVGPAAAFIGPLRESGSIFYYEVFAPVTVRESLAGWVAVRRTVNDSPGTLELIESLVGLEATFLVGNRDGSLWTDLQQTQPPPPTVAEGIAAAESYQRDGRRVLARSAALSGAPWQLLVELPERVALAPARELVWPLAVLTFAALAVGLFGARVVSRQITAPLREVTDAAEGIASGDYTRRVRVPSGDQLGTLAQAFNALAAEVARSRDFLEEQVAERTLELQRTAQQLRETRDELVQGERLAMLDQLASGLGHELRNPLAVMRNSVYVLRAALPEATPDTRRYLEVIDREVRTADGIIEELLAFSRTAPAQREELAVADIVERAAQQLPQDCDIDVRVDLPAALPPVCADAAQVDEILANVVDNARLAMPGKGSLHFSAELENPTTVVLRIRDNGPGVPEEHRELVFEPLYTTRARGIGLGLSVARSLARNNLGDLTVEPSDGHGASFVLRLPAVES